MFLLSVSTDVKAQQDPMYTQYYFNMQTINPAYSGSWESMGFTVLGRHQWVGIEGAPRTYTFSMQTPLKGENAALGFNVLQDKIGKENRLSFWGDYSYRLRLSESSYLRLGLKFGATYYQNNLNAYKQLPNVPYDDYSSGLIKVPLMPNFGVGAFWYSKRFYLGFSIPKIIENTYKDKGEVLKTTSDLRHFFLSGGYVFRITDYFRFKPTFLVKAHKGAPVEFDLSGNFLLGDKVWLGANYRTGDSFGFVAQWIFNKRLRIGYGIDFTTTELRHYNNGSHEVMISYELGSIKKWSTPRMF